MKIRERIHRLRKNWKSMKYWPSFPRRWTKLKMILRPTLFIVGLFLIFLPAYFQQVSITQVYKELEIPSAPVEMNLNFSEPREVYISFPYRIKNSGFYNLEDIEISISLKLNYTNKNTHNKTQAYILQSTTGSYPVRVSKSLSEVLYEDYSSFNWGNISQFLIEGDELKEITLLMDIELSFYMSWVERDRILISDINLSSGVEESGIQHGYVSTYRENSLNISFLILLWLTLSLIVIVSFLVIHGRGTSRKKKSVNLKHLRSKDPLKRRNILKTTLKIFLYTISIVILDIYLLYNQRRSAIVSKAYILRYEISIWLSIFILILLYIISLLPSLYPRKYRKYSIQEGIRSFIASIFLYTYILTFLLTAIITYKIGDNTIVIRDTFPSYVPPLALYVSYIALKLIDLFNFSRYKIHYNKVIIQEERMLSKAPTVSKDVDEFNKTIFSAIRTVSSEGRDTSLSQIKKYFEENNISKILYSDVKLNLNYMDSLVANYFLESRKLKDQHLQSFLIYSLTPKAEKLLGLEELEDVDYLVEETLPSRLSEKTFTDTDVEELKYCTICGAEIKFESSSICKNCQEQGFSEVIEFNNCPVCGELIIANNRFCVFCHHSFYKPSSKYDKYSLEQLYKLSINYDRYFRLLLIVPIHFIIIFLFLQLVFQVYNIIILFDFIDSIILSLFFGSLIFYTYHKRHSIRNERISRDIYYRILLSISRYRKAENETSTESDFKQNRKKFRQENAIIKDFFNKFKRSERFNLFSRWILIALIVSSISLIFINFIYFLITLLIGLFFAYPLALKTHIRYLNDLFRLGVRYRKEDYVNYIYYIIKYLNYL